MSIDTSVGATDDAHRCWPGDVAHRAGDPVPGCQVWPQFSRATAHVRRASGLSGVFDSSAVRRSVGAESYGRRLIEGFRSALLGTNPMPWDLLIPGAIVAVIVFVGGALYFRRMERIFADVV